MAILGFGQLQDVALPALWDTAESRRLALRDGATFEGITREVQDVLNVVNASLLREPFLGDLFSVQDNLDVEYPVGGTGAVQEATEFSVPDPYKGDSTGHSLPIKAFTRSLGWTYQGLTERRRVTLDSDISNMVADIQDHFRQRVYQQLFRMEAVNVRNVAGGSVPFADGGVADSKYVPVRSPDGTNFASSHDHYLRHAALNDANLLLAVKHLKEHGHQMPFVALGSTADSATWKALTGWLKPEFSGIRYFDTTSGDRAMIQGVEVWNGAVETEEGLVYVKLLDRIPTGYYNLHKPYGALSSRNPLRLRIDPLYGYGWRLQPGMFVNAPMLLAVAWTKWDVGIGEDRTNSVNVYINAAGDYVTPTIT